MEDVLNKLREVAELQKQATPGPMEYSGEGTVRTVPDANWISEKVVSEYEAWPINEENGKFCAACGSLDFADLLRAFDCTQQANRELAEQNLQLARRLGNPPARLAPGTPEVGGESALGYADEETDPVTGCVLPSEGVSRLQVRQAAAKVACCGLVAEAVLLRMLADEVERLQELEAGKEAARA